MTVRVRFAPSPTGPLHVGGALGALANRRFADERGGRMLLRIDDTDPVRTVAGAQGAILRDLEWLGIRWDEGPIRQSERAERYGLAASRLLALGEVTRESDGSVRFGDERRATLLRADGSATFHLATAVDDLELEITHVIRGLDQLPNTPLHESLIRALGGSPPEYLHHGLLLDEEGAKLSKRAAAATVAELRERGIPSEAVVAYLAELGLPRTNVQFDAKRLQRLAIEAIAALPDRELARRVGAPAHVVPALRGARDLTEARAFARAIRERPPAEAVADGERSTLERLHELLVLFNGSTLDEASARSIVRELKAVGGDLRAARRVLTGQSSGPELWAVVLALPREEALARIDAAL